MAQKPLNVGLVGGGRGAFIVHPHQKAIHFDGTRRVVAGALFPDPKIALEEAANWPYPIKGYGSYDEMIAANATLPEDQKLDYILIVTPNFVHYDPAMKAMKAGIAVFCEKPLCLNLKEANELVKASRKLNVPFGLAWQQDRERLGLFLAPIEGALGAGDLDAEVVLVADADLRGAHQRFAAVVELAIDGEMVIQHAALNVGLELRAELLDFQAGDVAELHEGMRADVAAATGAAGALGIDAP